MCGSHRQQFGQYEVAGAALPRVTCQEEIPPGQYCQQVAGDFSSTNKAGTPISQFRDRQLIECLPYNILCHILLYVKFFYFIDFSRWLHIGEGPRFLPYNFTFSGIDIAGFSTTEMQHQKGTTYHHQFVTQSKYSPICIFVLPWKLCTKVRLSWRLRS